MSVTEIKQAIGRWELRLSEETPVTLLDKLTYFGHIALLPGQMDVAQYGDNLLSAARYVGVLRGRDQQNAFKLKGSGMAFWLGDEDGKGDVLETLLTFSGTTFANTVRALLPPSGAITEGMLYSVAGTYDGKHQWVTPREAITYVTDLFGAEFRVNYNGTLDAGLISDLYVTVPKTLILPKGFGSDLLRTVISGEQSMGIDVEDTTTRVVLLAEGEGTNIVTAAANAPATSYKDIHGNPLKMTRLVSESSTAEGNAAARAQLQLNRFLNPRRAVDLSTSEYDVKGTFIVGDYLDVYDPVNGFYDANREIYWEGERINPMALRCVEMTWPIPVGWTVAFRDVNGAWHDLTDYYVPEEGDTTIVVGELARGLSSVGGEAVGVRPNLPDAGEPPPDLTIPAAPVFTGFSMGAYESDDRTLAAIQATWAQPLNGDGSVITDGDHYELRYRPNAIIGTKVPWDYLSGEYNVEFEDEFNTPVSGGYGSGWSTGADLNVSGGEATTAHPTFNVVRSAIRGAGFRNVEVVASHRIDYMPTGASTVLGVAVRWIDVNNRYWVRVEPNTDGSVTAKITRYKAGVYSELATYKIPGMVHTPGITYWTKTTLYEDTISHKVWQGEMEDEPEQDTLSVWDQDTIAGSGGVGFSDYIVSGATNPLGSLTRHSHFRLRSLAPDNVANAFSWDDLGSWDAITSPPVAVTPNWTTAFVGWDQNTYTLTEMSPGLQYEFQIRAVDAANPPHQGPWSASEFVTTTGDVIAPDTPAPPSSVAASLIGVQIEHRLGRASGGAFNLQYDLSRLEVHASHTPTFFPDNTTKIGDMIATGTMVRGGITAVGSFKVDQADTVWIRVIAVDRSGNKSGPSDAVQSNVVLIDNAHISDLSVSKLTAGTITAQSVLASQMEVGPGGNIRVTDGSFDAYDGNGDKRIEVGQLSDGSFDLAAFEPGTGAQVNLAQLAFGTRAAKSSGSASPPAGGAYVSIPGTLVDNVYIGTSGRVLFFITASANLDTYTREGFNMTVRGYGPGGVSLPGLARLSVTNGIELAGGPGDFLGGTFTFEGSIAEFEDGLTPGYWDFWLEVRNWSSGSMDGTLPGDPYIGSGATLIVMPF